VNKDRRRGNDLHCRRYRVVRLWETDIHERGVKELLIEALERVMDLAGKRSKLDEEINVIHRKK
jgi:hypothetical protein